MPFSILILTLNEEDTLTRCLNAIAWCNDIVVLDSFSTDKTEEITKNYPVRFFQRKFDSFAEQRNYALEHIEFKYQWIFHLDADEIITASLRNEAETEISADRYDAYRVPSKMMFNDHWLRFAATYPTYQVRFGRHPHFRFRQVGHGQREDIDDDRIGTLACPYLHYSFSKGFRDWFEKHNRYSSQEAEETVKFLRSGNVELSAIVSSDPVKRRRALKELSCRFPGRPLVKFIYMYFFRAGILDGRAGFTYCVLQAVYEYMICLKVMEIKRQRKNYNEN